MVARAKITPWVLGIFAWGFLASMLAAAFHDVSMAWDVWYYHLPFAARIWGIVPAHDFAYDPMNQARFDGFPLLGEALQGFFWRVTGRPESANLVALASVPLFAWFVKRRFDVPMYATILALLAVPLVQIHATSCYVDLPSNTAASALVLVAIAVHARDERPTTREVILALVLGAIAANMKALMHPIVLAALVAIALRVRERKTLALIALTLPIVFATPLKNLVVHHNPYYPIAMNVFGHTLRGPDDPYSSSPVWLEHAPRPIRFLCSIFEIGMRPLGDSKRWTVDQWTPPDERGYRMGGFFGAYVALHVGLFVWRVVRDRRDRTTRACAIGFAALTAIVSVLPQSHELRYYMCFIIVLVTLNLWLAARASREDVARDTLRVDLPRVTFACVAMLGVVLVATRGAYAYPSGESFDQLVRAEVDAHALGAVQNGEHVCVRHAPWNFLWAARFHAPKSYTVTEAVTPNECAGAPSL